MVSLSEEDLPQAGREADTGQGGGSSEAVPRSSMTSRQNTEGQDPQD
jgi:hypothetical protein